MSTTDGACASCDETAEQAVRTIICREVRPGPQKDRWHPLYTTCVGDPEDVLAIFRARQGREQAHRVEVHELRRRLNRETHPPLTVRSEAVLASARRDNRIRRIPAAA